MLVAIAIPIFTTQLEKSRDATDQANIRSAYAELSAALLTNTTASGVVSDLANASFPWANSSPSTTSNAGTYVATIKGQGTNAEWDNGGSYAIGSIAVSTAKNFTKVEFTVNDAGQITAIAASTAFHKFV